MHAHSHERTSAVLKLSLLATLLYIILLIAAGVRANSLALLSEAGHNFSDFLSLLLSWVAVFLEARPPDEQKTYGYHRAGVLAAFVNAALLIVVAGFIFWEAWTRLRVPEPVEPGLMMAVAAVGVAMNGVIAYLLWRTGRDVNLRSALVHQVGDTASTASVIAGGALILWSGQTWIDPALSVLIGVLVLWSSLGIIRETLNILLEGTPRGLKLEEVTREIAAGDGVIGVHDLHVWSLGSEVHALSCHIRIVDIPPSQSEAILRDVNCRLLDRFGIRHTTIQFEHEACESECAIPVMPGKHLHRH